MMERKSETIAGNILVIDDDVELCKLVSRFLGSEGFKVQAVQTSNHGVERALSGDYDLVVLDVMLPGMDGFEVLRRIRAESRTPVLMLTARGDDLDLLEKLVKSAGRVVGREELVREVLGREFSPFDRSIDTHVCNLRRKVGSYSDGTERIKGVRGVGYLLATPSETKG